MVRDVHRSAARRGTVPELGTSRHGGTHFQGPRIPEVLSPPSSRSQPSWPQSSTVDVRKADIPSLPQHGWVFPSPTSASRHLKEIKHLYGRISVAGGAKFWLQRMRNCYLAVAERDLLLPSSLTSRLLNRAPVGGIAAGHPEDWTTQQLEAPAQRIADRVEELTMTHSQSPIS